MVPRKEDNVPATLRAISVLEALVAADRPASLAELTDSSRLPKPTLYRMNSGTKPGYEKASSCASPPHAATRPDHGSPHLAAT